MTDALDDLVAKYLKTMPVSARGVDAFVAYLRAHSSVRELEGGALSITIRNWADAPQDST